MFNSSERLENIRPMADDPDYVEYHTPQWPVMFAQIDPPKRMQLERIKTRFEVHGTITSADLKSLLTDPNVNGLYECTLCSRTFRMKNTAACDHIAISHFGRVINCTRCDQSFSRVYDARQHCRIVHVVGGYTGFKCLVCELTFTKRFNLNRHIQSSHPA